MKLIILKNKNKPLKPKFLHKIRIRRLNEINLIYDFFAILYLENEKQNLIHNILFVDLIMEFIYKKVAERGFDPPTFEL